MDIEIMPYHSLWKTEFLEIGRRIREALGDAAVRIYHIGSTSVEGLAAKPIIDIQVSVRSWDDFEHLICQFNSIGYIHRADNSDKSGTLCEERAIGVRKLAGGPEKQMCKIEETERSTCKSLI